MADVKENWLANKKLQDKFYNIQTGRRIIASRQLLFLRKLVHNSDKTSLPKQLPIVWVDHKRPRGQPHNNQNATCKKPTDVISQKHLPYRKLEEDSNRYLRRPIWIIVLA